MTRWTRAQIALVVFAPAILLLALLAFAPPTATASEKFEPPETPVEISWETPTPTPTPTPEPPQHETIGVPGQSKQLPGELVYSGWAIDVYVGENTLSITDVITLSREAETALEYMEQRFDQPLTERVAVGVYSRSKAPNRSTRGIAYSPKNYLHIFYNSGEDTHKARAILAHELAHQLQADAYGADAQRTSDLVLLEGLATWISGDYWLSVYGAESWQAHAHHLMSAGYDCSLHVDGHNLAQAGSLYSDPDIAYELWAGFVDYLITTYGWENLHAVYQSGQGRSPGSSNYQGVYGKSFGDLANEWRDTLH